MAAPVLTLDSLVPIADGSNLTTLTGGAGNGFTGADYGYAATVSYQTKQDGGHQTVITYFGGATQTGSFGMGRTVTFTDRTDPDGGDAVSGSTSTGYKIISPSGGGVYYSLPADQSLRKFRWFGNADGGSGHWLMTATISDGSNSPVSLSMPSYETTPGGQGHGFLLTYRAHNANSTLDVRFTKQDAVSAATGFFCSYIETPVAAPRPRGFLIDIT